MTQVDPSSGYDLTDRDSVRLLLATRKQAEQNKSVDLSSALTDALSDFGRKLQTILQTMKLFILFNISLTINLRLWKESANILQNIKLFILFNIILTINLRLW